MRLFKHIAHIFLALMLLFSTMGITMSTHYCMGRVQDVAYFQKAHNCMEMAGMDHEMDCPMDCCDDTNNSFKIDDLQAAAFHCNLESTLLLIYSIDLPKTTLVQTYEAGYLTQILKNTPFLSQDITIEEQTFLL